MPSQSKRRPRTPEQRAAEAAKMRERRASLSPEQRQAIRETERMRDRERYAALAPEEREAKIERQRQRLRERPLTAEQRAAKNQRARKRAAGRTEEQRQARLEQERALMWRKRATWTPEEREAAYKNHRDRERQRRAARTPEQRAHYNLRLAAKRLGYDPDVIIAHFVSHDGCCDICGRTAIEAGCTYGRLAIDHDHETGAFRGLLCDRCNHALGHMGDSPERLFSAAEYLLKAKAGSMLGGGAT